MRARRFPLDHAQRGAPRVKLEQQILVTDAGPELMTHNPLDLV